MSSEIASLVSAPPSKTDQIAMTLAAMPFHQQIQAQYQKTRKDLLFHLSMLNHNLLPLYAPQIQKPALAATRLLHLPLADIPVLQMIPPSPSRTYP